MRKNIFSSLFLILIFCCVSQAQDFVKLDTLTNHIKNQAIELMKLTAEDIRIQEIRSRKEIEGAFLAEQLFVSTKLIRRMINDKRRLSELRYAGSMLTRMAARFPKNGSHRFEWKKAEDWISEMSRELRGMGSSANDDKEYDVDESNIIGKAFWNGMVDNDVQISVNRTKLSTNTMNGTSYSRGIYSFTSSLPKQSRIRVGVRLKKGRGKVHVIQQPDKSNDYTAIIEIIDTASGAKPYSLVIYWYRR